MLTEDNDTARLLARLLIESYRREERSMRKTIASIEGEYQRYKLLAERAIAQLSDEGLSDARSPEHNSIATLVWHVSGNLASRFTDFLTSDGEKPWRERDGEFIQRMVSRAELTAKWVQGWGILFAALGELDDSHLNGVVRIRGVSLSVVEALHRSLAHTSYHVGQIVLLAKEHCGREWRHLSIPPGGSAAYNENPVAEKPPGSRT